MRTVVLVGFMGAGKSVVGALLAAELGVAFLDLDSMVEQRAGRTVSQIFEHEGELGFRTRESEALESLAGSDVVVACGGGVVTSAANRALLRKLGTVVWLRVSPHVAYARVADESGRPLAEEGREQFERLWRERVPLYTEVADLQVDTDTSNPSDVARTLATRLREGVHEAECC